MALLRTLTLVYTAVLVLALAVALTTIAVYLWRVAFALRDVRAALSLVRERTGPLRQHLQPLEALTEEHVEAFEDATTLLERATGQLGEHEKALLAAPPASA